MPRAAAFHPASLDLMPGEPAQPPLRLLDVQARRATQGPLPIAPPADWLTRLRRAIGRTLLA